jgi:hypothetical protein
MPTLFRLSCLDHPTMASESICFVYAFGICCRLHGLTLFPHFTFLDFSKSRNHRPNLVVACFAISKNILSTDDGCITDTKTSNSFHFVLHSGIEIFIVGLIPFLTGLEASETGQRPCFCCLQLRSLVNTRQAELFLRTWEQAVDGMCSKLIRSKNDGRVLIPQI